MEEKILKQASNINSGMVRCFKFNSNKIKLTQITTFCPDEIGPGPTHVYLIESEKIVMLDTGIPTDLAKGFFYYWRNQRIPPEIDALPADHSFNELLTGFELTNRSLSEVDILVFSHGHLDHFLMTGKTLEYCDPVVMAHIEDTPAMCNPWGLLNMWIAGRKQMIPTGMPLQWSKGSDRDFDPISDMDPSLFDFSVQVHKPIIDQGPLMIGDNQVEDVEVIHIPGHSPGSVGLLVGKPHERILLCGDTLLNPITPNPDDLLSYLRTLEFLGALEGVKLTLPAHGKEIRDLKQRVHFLKEHHRNRLRLTYEACSKERCVWDIASMAGYFDTYVDPKLFNFLAGKEALVHMELLQMCAGVKRVDIRNNIHYFVNSGEPFHKVYGRALELVKEYRTKPIMRF